LITHRNNLLSEPFLSAPACVIVNPIQVCAISLVQASVNSVVVDITKPLVPSASPEASPGAAIEHAHHNCETNGA
jgi:hypothetical protein